ncbi:MAG: choline dehydrogenase [Acidiferrobacteraceae bacterium]|nr:choline dehydrogenase [Acidiferrobacteraceae bacterium]|tara:strand:- start:9076 stop:10770 length:1695 start_codon:yes stop_codon:yes gene_type:complete
MLDEPDYIIVGAGSAGCVLAARLTEDESNNVVLLEAGGNDRSVTIKMPTALSIPMNTKRFNWGFKSQPEPFVENRIMDCPRGFCIGGSSSINGMVYVRGHARDFDQWEAQGATGWNYQSCLPYFRKAETWIGGGDSYRGGDGPLAVCLGNEMRLNPLYKAFIESGQQAGYPITHDYNGYQQEGFGPMQMTVDRGVRASTAHAYLRPTENRPNLKVVSNALVNRIIVRNRKAVGIEYQRKGELFNLTAKQEIIISCGSIGSPVLLQRSGIGPKKILDNVGIKCVMNLPGVGQNLQDHLEIYFQHQCKEPITLNGKIGVIDKTIIAANWLLFKKGLGATNHFESCAFIRSDAGVEWPDIQYHFLPGAMRYDGRAAFKGHGFQVHVGPTRPASRGHVRIRSRKPSDSPLISFNYLSEESDKKTFRQCIHLTREIFTQPAMSKYCGVEIQPGRSVKTDDDIDSWVRRNCESAYHPSCTCRIGLDEDSGAVLDSECRVKGLESLRVVDSSVFPVITNGNINAPTIMVAERVADMIKGIEMSSQMKEQVWIDHNWKTQQRTEHSPSTTTE